MGDWEALVRAVALGMAWVAWVKDWEEKAWARGAGVLVAGERAEASAVVAWETAVVDAEDLGMVAETVTEAWAMATAGLVMAVG